jgi:hypothetical protein
MNRRSYRIVVPTRDSARWIGTFHYQYHKMGLSPLYLVDTRSGDDTAGILARLGAEVVAITPSHDRVESMLACTKTLVESEWIVRFDDDELPSHALIRWLDERLAAVSKSSLAISRRDAFRFGDALYFSRMEHYYFHPSDPTFLNPQWRGFRPASVHFTDVVHTPGFSIGDFDSAPQSAYFVHFDWIIRTPEQRLEKMRRYDRQSSSASWTWALFYLPEHHHPDACRWTSFETEEFDRLATELDAIRR